MAKKYSFFDEVEEESGTTLGSITDDQLSTTPKKSRITSKKLTEILDKLKNLESLPVEFSDLRSEFGLLQTQMNELAIQYHPPTIEDLIQKLIEIGEKSGVRGRQYISERYRLAIKRGPITKEIDNARFQTGKISTALEMILENYKLIPKK